jgi:hypothetical protein
VGHVTIVIHTATYVCPRDYCTWSSVSLWRIARSKMCVSDCLTLWWWSRVSFLIFSSQHIPQVVYIFPLRLKLSETSQWNSQIVNLCVFIRDVLRNEWWKHAMTVRPRYFSKSLLLWFRDTSTMTNLVLSVRMSIFRYSFFLDVTQRRLVFSYRLSGTTYRTEIQGSKNTHLRCVTSQKS